MSTSDARRQSDERILINFDALTPQGDEVLSQVSSTVSTFADAATEGDKLDQLRRGNGVTLTAEAISALLEARQLAMPAVYQRLNLFKDELGDFFGAIRTTLPPSLTGELYNPNGVPAEILLVDVEEPDYGPDEGVGPIAWAPRPAVTDGRGKFAIDLPSVPVPQNGLRLRVRGHNAVANVAVSRVDAVDGDIGLRVLAFTLQPLQRTILGDLADVLPVDAQDADRRIVARLRQPPLRLGEGDCASEYATEGGSVSRYSYSMLFRLVDPLVSPRILLRDVSRGGGVFPTPIPSHALARADMKASDVVAALSAGGEWNFRDRQPVDEPIDVERFYDDVERHPHSVPKAGTLGLGYTVTMRTVAIHRGLSLGELVYSLPLAPGEEQRISVFEQRQQLSVRERESLTFREEQDFEEGLDTSMEATFASAFEESIYAKSKVDSRSRSGGIGAAGGVAGFFKVMFAGGHSAGFGGSKSSGTTQNWQNTSRDLVSSASEEFHSSLERAASAKREATRSGVRLATSSDRREATTKLLVNRNHCHALTMQWFQVLRDFTYETRVEGVQLVCFVPLQLIAFHRTAQEFLDLTMVVDRPTILNRYRAILRFADVLTTALRRQRLWTHRNALQRLREFAADPEAEPDLGNAQDVVTVSMQATILPFEEVSVSLVTKSGDRIGPAVMVGGRLVIPADAFTTEQELIEHLRGSRVPQTPGLFVGAGVELIASLALPPRVSRSDVARLELRLQTRGFSYRLKVDEDAYGIWSTGLPATEAIKNVLEAAKGRLDPLVNVSWTADQIHDLIGPLQIWDVQARVVGTTEFYVDDFSGIGERTSLSSSLPLPARNVTPILSRDDLVAIEDMYQHIVRNTVEYSREVWASMTDEERAILLERYTIGVPEGGLEDASQEVPLLNAVTNRVLGFFGNAMIMPFHVPAAAAEDLGFTTRDVQDAILRFHRQGFSPDRRHLSLPTRGTLGEAVLGRCNSCEKIDLTRFWNWQDSPTPAPVGDAPTFPAPDATLAAARAPADLVGNQPQNVITIAGRDTGASSDRVGLAELLKAVPELAKAGDLSALQTLQTQIAAETASAAGARDKAIDSATAITTSLAGNLTSVLGGKKAAGNGGAGDDDAESEPAENNDSDSPGTQEDD